MSNNEILKPMALPINIKELLNGQVIEWERFVIF